jgi:NADH-quinone oxidoreductase subunit C
MALDLAGVYGILEERFGEAVQPPPAVQAGESWIPVKPEAIAEVAGFLRDDSRLRFESLMCLSGVDALDEKNAEASRFWVVYHLHSMPLRHKVTLKVELPRQDGVSLPTVSRVWTAADWSEREVFDLFGVSFEGHPDPRRILLPDDWMGYPLRKDYKDPEDYHGIKVKAEYPA